MMNKGLWLVLLIAVLVLGVLSLFWIPSRPQPDPQAQRTSGPAWFADVSDDFKLNFVHDAGPVGNYFMPQQVGSGAACFDFDNDGLLDLLLLQNGGSESTSTNRLYRQHPAGEFLDVSEGSGLAVAGYNMGVGVGDANNDGYLDVLVTQYPGVKFFQNQGDGKFREISQEAGLDSPSWGTSSAFFDYDRDGWLDLVVICYVDYDPTWPCKGPNGRQDYCAPKTFKGRVSRLFHNVTGNGATPSGAARFEDVTITSGLGEVPGPGLGVLCADLNGDDWPDIFVANDGEPNRLWINRHNGTFAEEAIQRGIAYNMNGQAHAGMGIAFGDADSDGLADIFVSHLAQETHALWGQGPAGLFQDRTNQSGVVKSIWRGTCFGTLFGDFTNAGRLDLALANGSVFEQQHEGDPALGPFWRKYGQRNQLFAGDGKGHFRDVSLDTPDFCGHDNVARGLAKGDFDGDGGLDLVVTTIGGRTRLLRNVAPQRGHWLSIRAVDPALNRDALGAVIRVFAGDHSSLAWLHPAESYLSSSEPRAHFGFGPIATIDRIEVTWPDGAREIFPGCSTNQRLELRKGEGKKDEA
jgi:hypothetical protein